MKTPKKFQRNLKKGVDKVNRICYNKDVPKGTKQICDLRHTARERGIL